VVPDGTALVLFLGAHPAAVIAFEVILNAASEFNHANVYLPVALERILRLVALGLLVAVTLVPAMFKRWRRQEVLTPVQLHERLEREDDMWVLDVRNPDEINGPLGHISGARVIPVAELEAHWAELEPDRDRPVAVVCKTDKRSRQAVQWLTTRGFTHVYLVMGGMEAWRAAELPVQQ
jgi:rhodanese-related sulfurtransferase